FGVRVDRVLRRPPDALQDIAKLLPVSCFADPVIGVEERGRLGGCPPQGVTCISFAMDDRAVPGRSDFEMLIRLTLDVNHFVTSLGFGPSPLDAVFVRIRWIEGLDVEVLDIGAVVGESPGDAIVVPDDNQWRARQSESLYVIAGSGEVSLVPDRRYRKLKVGVVGE